MSGKKREKFIGADQMLLEHQDDKQLQATLESAKKDAEEELETLNNNQNTEPKKRNPASDKFTAGNGGRKKGHLSPEFLMANPLCLSSFWRCSCGFV
ncbi:MAG: hypothetical protein ACK56W_09420 [Pirellula sp.]|jgi:hypothetical protein|nr:hypothetical protein [Pirellula sp.]